ncbi:MAG: hemolysin family protein [Zavarzinella sp.]
MLIAINAYFVAIEFALVAVRSTRVDELRKQQVAGAESLHDATTHLDRSIAAAQLGITVASIALGAVGESVLAKLLEPTLTFMPSKMGFITRHGIATVFSVAVITYLHVIFGEQVPKMVAIANPDRVALKTVIPLNFFARITSPVLRFMNWSGNMLLRLLGYSPQNLGHASVHSVDELRAIVSDTRDAGLLGQEQATFVDNVFQLSKKLTRDCMVPIAKVDAVEVNTPLEKIIAKVRASGHTRLPVYLGTKENIVGVLNSKSLFYMQSLKNVMILQDAMYPPAFVSADALIADVLKIMKKEHRHMAIVRETDQSVVGMITLEDIVEEIIGELEDEHPKFERNSNRKSD